MIIPHNNRRVIGTIAYGDTDVSVNIRMSAEQKAFNRQHRSDKSKHPKYTIDVLFIPMDIFELDIATGKIVHKIVDPVKMTILPGLDNIDSLIHSTGTGFIIHRNTAGIRKMHHKLNLRPTSNEHHPVLLTCKDYQEERPSRKFNTLASLFSMYGPVYGNAILAKETVGCDSIVKWNNTLTPTVAIMRSPDKRVYRLRKGKNETCIGSNVRN